MATYAASTEVIGTGQLHSEAEKFFRIRGDEIGEYALISDVIVTPRLIYTYDANNIITEIRVDNVWGVYFIKKSESTY